MWRHTTIIGERTANMCVIHSSPARIDICDICVMSGAKVARGMGDSANQGKWLSNYW